MVVVGTAVVGAAVSCVTGVEGSVVEGDADFFRLPHAPTDNARATVPTARPAMTERRSRGGLEMVEFNWRMSRSR